MMKKIYINPLTEVMQVQSQQMMALSLGSGNADESEVLVKDDDWNIWGDDLATDED